MIQSKTKSKEQLAKENFNRTGSENPSVNLNFSV